MNLLSLKLFIVLPLLELAVVRLVLGISPFQFHFQDSSIENHSEDYIYIRGKHFLKSESPELEINFKINENVANGTNSSRTPSAWFPQCVNHFHSSKGESIPGRIPLNSICPENKRWKQRYWINSELYESGGPIFFMFGGEGSAEGFVDMGIWVKYAVDFGALVVCLEHRFYGQSFPTLDTSFESMKLLTSQQGLADAAVFIQWLKYNNSVIGNLSTAKVVVFGGSYPGNLAAWMRQKYPDLVNIAVASSAPVEARYEYPEYFRTVSEVIYQLDQTCFWKIFRAFQCMDDLVSDRKCHETKTKYTSKYELLGGLHQCQSCNFSMEYDRQVFFHRLGVKWGSNFPGYKSVSKCQTFGLQNSSDVIDDYGNFLLESGFANKSCTTTNPDKPPMSRLSSSTGEYETADEVVEFVKSLKGHARDAKSWTWQTCREFGYFQVADPTIQLFSDEWNSLIDVTRCQIVFPDANFTSESIEAGIKLTNEYYKGKEYDGSCTIFVNGEWDPWHSLGFNQQNETTSDNTVISIPEAEHCADMRNDPDASPHMFQAQKRIQEQIRIYLNDPNCAKH